MEKHDDVIFSPSFSLVYKKPHPSQFPRAKGDYIFCFAQPTVQNLNILSFIVMLGQGKAADSHI